MGYKIVIYYPYHGHGLYCTGFVEGMTAYGIISMHIGHIDTIWQQIKICQVASMHIPLRLTTF